MPFRVYLRYFLVVRLPLSLWQFETQQLAHDWCDQMQPPHPGASTWEVVEVATNKVVDSGPWTWQSNNSLRTD